MALFQKNPFDTRQQQTVYTLGAHKSLLIVGLGNVGKRYEGTRHNIGFACVDAFAKAHEFDNWAEKKDLKCHITTKNLGEARVILIKPTTYMNLSGEAVQKTAQFYKIKPENILVIHDELDVQFGQIRMRMGGSDAGHNGIKSLVQHIGANFGRVRVGVDGNQPEQIDSADYVLAKFTEKERGHIPTLIQEVTSILTEYIFSGQLPHDTRSFLT